MASLVEELINVLTEEEKVYRTLAANGEKKRQIIIDADIPALEAITDLDQQAGDELLIMSNKQVSLLTDIANVLGKSDEKMTVARCRKLRLNIRLCTEISNQPCDCHLLI